MNTLFSGKNHKLFNSSSYIKDLYFTMLCFILNHESEMSQSQEKQIEKMMDAVGHKDDVIRFQKRGLAVNAEVLAEMEPVFLEEELSLPFLLDALVLILEDGGNSYSKEQLLEELLEVLHINNENYQYLLAVATMISSRNLRDYHSICRKKPKTIRISMFRFYFSITELDLLEEAEYNSIVQEMLSYCDDFARLKQALSEIGSHYLKTFKKHYLAHFHEFETRAPLAIFITLMNENIRLYYLNNKEIKGKLQKIFDKNKQAFLPYIVDHDRELYDYITDNNAYFKNIYIEPEERMCLVIHFDKGETNLSQGKYSMNLGGMDGIMDYKYHVEPLSPEQVNGEFLLFQGFICCSGYIQEIPRISYMIDPTI